MEKKQHPNQNQNIDQNCLSVTQTTIPKLKEQPQSPQHTKLQEQPQSPQHHRSNDTKTEATTNEHHLNNNHTTMKKEQECH